MKHRILLSAAVCCLFVFGNVGTSEAAPAMLDPTFDGDGKAVTSFGSDSFLNAIARQSDGKIIAVGNANNGSDTDWKIGRYNMDGSVDTNFSNGGFITRDFGGTDSAEGVAVQSDGKLVVSGFVRNSPGSNPIWTIARYNADGSPDTSFGSGGTAKAGINAGGTPNERAYGLALQSDGKILLFGDHDTGQHRDNTLLMRFNSDGTLDGSFDGDGMRSENFSYHNAGRDVVAQTDGQIVVTGATCNSGSPCDTILARYNTNGSLDASFDGDGKVITSYSSGHDAGHDLALQPDGKIVLAGVNQNGDNLETAVARRYSTDGSLDTSFGTNGSFIIDENYLNGVALQPDGKIVVAGGSHNGSYLDWFVARIMNTGPAITGTAYVDTNSNGTKDSGEEAYAGMTVHLYSGNDTTNLTDHTTTTDANGNYSIVRPENTFFWLRIDVPQDYEGTTLGTYSFDGSNPNLVYDFGIRTKLELATVFTDDFTDTDNTALTDHDSIWQFISGAEPVIQNNQLTFAQVANEVGPTGLDMNDQCLEAEFQTPTAGILGLIIRHTPTSGYATNINPHDDLYDFSIVKAPGNTYFPFNSTQPKAIYPDGTHSMRICAVGNEVSAYMDGRLLGKQIDNDWTHGTAYIDTSNGNVVDNFKIEGTLVGPPVYPVDTSVRSASGNNSVTATVGDEDIPAGHTATVSVATGTFAGAVGCTDSQGNNYTVAADRNTGTGRLFVCTSHLSSALEAGDTVTATYPGFSGISVVSLNAISAFASNGTALAANSAAGNSASPSSGNITIGSPAVLFGVVAHNSTPIFTPAADYTLVGQVIGGSGAGQKTLSPMFRIVESGGTYSAGGTIANGGQFWRAAVIGYGD